ncbi:MAG: galactitol-1-phosphate 5-dehydrogenase, partial [Desulfobacteraceae bacterium]
CALPIFQLLKVAGCGKIIAVDIEPEKLDFALKVGADSGLNPKETNVPARVFELTKDRGADIAFEVVGVGDAVNCAIESVRKGGTVTLVGNTAPRIDFPLQWVVTRELKLQGSCSIRGEFEAVLDLLGRGVIDTRVILSAVAPLSEGAQWFERLYRKEKGLMKVILKPGA